MEDKLVAVIYQQFGFGALIAVAALALAWTVWRESSRLRKDVAYQVGRDLLGKRFDAYGALWACMNPVALYKDGQFGPTELRALRAALAEWYFSAQGGLFLTARARDFYFALQDLLAETSVLSNWNCDSRPRDSKGMFLQVVNEAASAPARDAIVAGLEDPERLSAKEWKGFCKAVSTHLAGSVAANSPQAGNLIFVSVQQVSSVLRTVLAHDVRSRLDVELP